MTRPPRLRLDELLVRQGLAENRTRARALILAGQVRHGTTVLDKAGKAFPADLALTVTTGPRYVGRGGDKLEGALRAFALDPTGLDILDVGASTGGFTDCLLQHGAASATCVDVGRAQLHGRLLADPRVVNLEQVNARDLAATPLPHPDYPFVVMDLSFISLTRVLEPVWSRVRPAGVLVALVKPQFEATKAEADRGRGIIADPAVRRRCLDQVLAFAAARLPGILPLGVIDSPLPGTDGNREFLAAWRKNAPGPPA